MRASTRREYRRLLVNFALTYFDREVRVRELDRAAVQHFVDWLTTRPGRDGRLCDRSIANALTPLRLALDAAVADGLLDANPAEHVVLPRRRAGRAWSMRERRFLTRAELVRLLDEVPARWRPFFELLAVTGLRVSEAVGLRWSDLVLDGDTPHLQVRMTVGISDGERLWAIRYSSQHDSRTLFVSADLDAVRRLHPDNERLQQLSEGDRVVVSEPLADLTGAWLEIPESTALVVADGAVEQRPFQPSP